jgi:hypothetical protein
MSIDVSPLIVGGQGTYQDGHYYTEYPDRDLAIQHCVGIKAVVDQQHFTHVVLSGGYTQAQTPALSEARSFLNIWQETQTRPNVPVILDEIALDSAENVIFGLMSLRFEEPKVRIKRIGFYSLWQFKKQRMTFLAKALGIESQLFFYALALAELANAGRLAQDGEEKQLASMAATQDYLLRGKEWESKRISRFRGDVYANRVDDLRNRFPRTFATLDGLQSVTLCEVQSQASANLARDIYDVINEIRQEKLKRFREAFLSEVLNPQ